MAPLGPDLTGVGASSLDSCTHHGVPYASWVVLVTGCIGDNADVGTMQCVWEIHWGGQWTCWISILFVPCPPYPEALEYDRVS
jgi:hypothetical protein